MNFQPEEFLLYQALTHGLIIGFATAAMIGPVNVMVLRRGVLDDYLSGWWVGLGAALVDAFTAYAVFSGLLRVGFHGLWKILLWGIGVVLILYIAYLVLAEIRDNPDLAENAKVESQTAFLDRPFVMGVLLVATNPFTLFYWMVMVSTLHLSETMSVDPAGRAATTLFSAVLVGEVGWYSLLTFAVYKMKNLFDQIWLSRISKISGFFLVGYALFMATKVIVHLASNGGTPFQFPSFPHFP
jgi:threonine/homoserine/homoserine lactone efflux protein